MIGLLDIQNSITSRLKTKFPKYKILAEYNEEDIEGPAFYVSVRPLTTTGLMRHKNRLINVDVMYFSEKQTHTENLEIMDDLEDLFYLVLAVEDRKLYIEDLNIRELDYVLVCEFTLDFNTESVTKYDPYIYGEYDYNVDAKQGDDGFIGEMTDLKEINLKDNNDTRKDD